MILIDFEVSWATRFIWFCFSLAITVYISTGQKWFCGKGRAGLEQSKRSFPSPNSFGIMLGDLFPKEFILMVQFEQLRIAWEKKGTCLAVLVLLVLWILALQPSLKSLLSLLQAFLLLAIWGMVATIETIYKLFAEWMFGLWSTDSMTPCNGCQNGQIMLNPIWYNQIGQEKPDSLQSDHKYRSNAENTPGATFSQNSRTCTLSCWREESSMLKTSFGIWVLGCLGAHFGDL